MKLGTEIAFYRRYRNHSAIEREGYGGKVIPDAVVLDVTVDNIISIKQAFGKLIPFVVSRGSLSDEKDVQKYRKTIIEAMKTINPKEAPKLIEEEPKEEKKMSDFDRFAQELIGLDVGETVIANATKNVRDEVLEERGQTKEEKSID